MTVAIKFALVLFVLVGAALAVFGSLEIRSTLGLTATSSGRAVALFSGYHQEVHRSPSGLSLKGSGPSLASYAEFTFSTPQGVQETVREPKVHVLELYRPGQQLEILLFPNDKPRLASFYSLYVRDLLILSLGLGFMLLSAGFWRFALPAFESVSGVPAGPTTERVHAAAPPSPAEGFQRFLDQKIGPVTARFVLRVSGGFLGFMLCFAVAAALWPYVAPLRFGAGGRLLQAMKEQRFDDARQMVEKGKGIRVVDEFGQNPLLLALEAGQLDLARKLIAAGSDVNLNTKMRRTPLRVAAESGDEELVKLLLARGAAPQHPDDIAPPFLYAMAGGHEAVAALLIEAGTDLQRRYRLGENTTGTVGDMAVLARKAALVELIRQRGGAFTPQP